MSECWKVKVVERFDNAAQEYDAVADVQRKAAERLMTFTPQMAKDILELGCGTGALSKQLIEKYPQAHFHFTDIAPCMLTQAKINVGECNADWSVMDAEAPSLTRKYDLIIANMVFQWLEEREAAIDRLSGYLKPDGVLLYSQPGEHSFLEWRETLDALGYPSGLLDFKTPLKKIGEDFIPVEYGSTKFFLERMKRAGTHRPRAGYKALSPSKLQKALRACDKKHAGRITWHVQYGSHAL